MKRGFWQWLDDRLALIATGFLLFLLYLCVDGSSAETKWILGLAICFCLTLLAFVRLKPGKQEAAIRLVAEAAEAIGGIVNIRMGAGVGPFGLGGSLDATIQPPTPEEDAERLRATGGGE